MGIKLKSVDDLAAASAEAEYKGPWGEITASEQRYIHFVRDVNGIEERWSYPYETILRMIYRRSETEEIEILAGGDAITIRGYGLEKFIEPLERRWLVRVEKRLVRFATSGANGCYVTDLKIESSRS